jgi:hypothetical protein
MFRPAHASLAAIAFLAACAVQPPARQTLETGTLLPTPFAEARPIDASPAGWHTYKLLRFKRPTRFTFVKEGDDIVVHAHAASSVSGIQQNVSVDPQEFPYATWRWRVPRLIEEADNLVPALADSPARVVFTFEGGRERLPPEEQITYDLAYAITGNPLPYATLMYIWEPGRPVGEILTHYNSTRVKMVVAANAQRDLSRWHTERVNLLEDYRRAFGEDPPRVNTVGIMTDSDNTGTVVDAFYGDIRFLAK